MKNPLFVKAVMLSALFLYATGIFAQSNTARTSAQDNTSRVSWLTFTATQYISRVSLRWSTASESNTTAFIVQRSNDSISWKNIGTVAAAGNSSYIQKYSFDDLSPARGINYYRLLEQTTSDRNTYSKVVRVEVVVRIRDFTAFPNPATDKIQVAGEEGATVEVYNLNGDLVLLREINADNEIDISQWKRGWYILRSGEQVVKIIVR